jgi:hypothetical protein
MLLGGRFPESGRWIVGLFLYFLIAMVLALCLGRLLLNNVPWGDPMTEMVKLREGVCVCVPVCVRVCV